MKNSNLRENVKQLLQTSAGQDLIKLPEAEQKQILEVMAKIISNRNKAKQTTSPSTDNQTQTLPDKNQQAMLANSSFAIAKERKSKQDAS
jgi:hypothetical protein